MPEVISVAVTGDLVLDEPNAGHWLSGIDSALRGADLAIGHLEVPHTGSMVELAGDVPAPGAPIENLEAIAKAGFDMLTLAGNHIADCGAEGIAETVAELERLGIAHCGAGMTLDEARNPAFAEFDGQKVALLSYNCIGPQAAWATAERAGCSYLPLITQDGSDITPMARIEGVPAEAFDILSAGVTMARGSGADHVIVALHKGVVHTPSHIEPYERDVTRMAIEAGADAVISHHAHIVRGVEFYQGKPIFHSLGNGCVVTRALSPDQDHPARSEWAGKRKELFGFEPDPAYHLAPFHPEAVNAFIGMLRFRRGKAPEAAIVPVHVEAPGRPVLADGERADDIRRYVEDITSRAGLAPIHIAEDGRLEEAR